MSWLIKLLVRKRVLDFVQNYLDCPANWQLHSIRTNCLVNKKHKLEIELDTPLDLKDRNTHLDHYMPLSKGGAHSISNVVWSCAACNLTKNNKLPIKDSNDTSV